MHDIKFYAKWLGMAVLSTAVGILVLNLVKGFFPSIQTILNPTGSANAS